MGNFTSVLLLWVCFVGFFCFVLLCVFKYLVRLEHRMIRGLISVPKASAAQMVPKQSTVLCHGLLKAQPRSPSPQPLLRLREITRQKRPGEKLLAKVKEANRAEARSAAGGVGFILLTNACLC